MTTPPGRESVRDLTVDEVAKGLTEGRYLLVDVREPNETDIERYPDAVIVPLSAFDPTAIPDRTRRVGKIACTARSSAWTSDAILPTRLRVGIAPRLPNVARGHPC